MGIPERLPANTRIAAALLDVLIADGETASRTRAIQALGLDETALRASDQWLPEAKLRAMFGAVAADRKLGRRVGRSLMTPASVGLFLRYSGVATPEKAYRRSDQLLARENRGCAYTSSEISEERARIVFRPAREVGVEGPAGSAFCGMREGMLSAIPCLFGLPPARVQEAACVHRGAPRCVFLVEWRRTPRLGLRIGAAAGVLLGLWLGSALDASFWSTLGTGLLIGGLGAAAGRSFDLVRQLEAVTGRQLDGVSLLDQADDALAEKMDQLAKIGTMVEAAAAESRRDHGSQGPGPEAQESELHHGGGVGRHRSDLAAIVSRAVDSVGPDLPEAVELQVRIGEGRMAIRGDPFQLEQMVAQLLRNGAQAAASAEEGGRLDVSLTRTPVGLEIAIQDNGSGMEQETVDRVFDPFLESPAAGVGAGFGLPVSYRIVQAHGGELRVEGEPGQGTRVTVVLPQDLGDPE
jgi:signal transduction histidine kinase